MIKRLEFEKGEKKKVIWKGKELGDKEKIILYNKERKVEEVKEREEERIENILRIYRKD